MEPFLFAAIIIAPPEYLFYKKAGRIGPAFHKYVTHSEPCFIYVNLL
jgi:hypothetical protein